MNKSETIGALAAALAKAQGVMGAAHKDSNNPFFKSKYADLASVIDAIKAPFSSNGLSFVQCTDFDDAAVIVETVLMHSSGEWISGRLRMMPVKNDPQGIGSCVTYAKRYGLQAMVGVPSDDDDGEAATRSASPNRPQAVPMPQKVKAAARAIKPAPAPASISGDPAESDLSDIAPTIPVKPTQQRLDNVNAAFASIGKDAATEYGKPLEDWTEEDMIEAQVVFKALRASMAHEQTI